MVSYAAHASADLAGQLRTAADRGVRVDLVLEDATGAAASLAELTGHATFWSWPRQNRGTGSVSLHAKVVAADTSTALVGSANLTGSALQRNIEVGVLLRDPSAVRKVVHHFRALMGPQGPLVRA